MARSKPASKKASPQGPKLLDLPLGILKHILTEGNCHSSARQVCKHLLQISDDSNELLELRGVRIKGPVELSFFKRLPNLRKFHFRSYGGGEYEMVALAAISSKPLAEIRLEGLRIDSRALVEFLKCFRGTLKHLMLKNLQITGSLEIVYQELCYHSLQELMLDMADEALFQVLSAQKGSLESLSLNLRAWEDVDWKLLQEPLCRLRSLEIHRGDGIDISGLVKHCPALTSLTLGDYVYSSSAATAASKYCPGLTIFSSLVDLVGPKDIALLGSSCCGLKTLQINLACVPEKEEMQAAFANLKGLEVLALRVPDSSITDQDEAASLSAVISPALSSLRSLRRLTLLTLEDDEVYLLDFDPVPLVLALAVCCVAWRLPKLETLVFNVQSPVERKMLLTAAVNILEARGLTAQLYERANEPSALVVRRK